VSEFANGKINNTNMLCRNNRILEFTFSMSKKSGSAHKSSGKVTFGTTSQQLSSQAGLIPFVKFLGKINFNEMFEKMMSHERGANAEFDLRDAVTFTTVGIAAGARSQCAVIRACADSVIQTVAGWEKIPSDTTLGRIFKSSSMKDVCEFESLIHMLRKNAWKYAKGFNAQAPIPSGEMWVDIDSTVKTVYGNQEGVQKGYNEKKRGKKSYHPQLAFCAMTKEILQAWHRCGSAYTANGSTAFYQQLRSQIDLTTRMVVRADSGYFSGSLLDELDNNGDGYLIKVKMRNQTGLLMKQDWKSVEGEDGWEQAEFDYQCAGWSKKRRFVAVRRERDEQMDPATFLFDAKSYDFFCYVTTEDFMPWQCHKEYGKRATCETWIEEAKNQTGLAALKTNDFWANSCLLQCAVLAYNTFRWMGLASLSKALLKLEPESIRCFLIRVAGKLCTGSRQLKIRVPENHLYPDYWKSWLEVAGLSAA
jgi:hypothetical protein